MKVGVFITSGIGNAIYLIPLIKALRDQNNVCLIAKSAFHSEEVFFGFRETLFDNQLRLNGMLKSFFTIVPHLLNKFDTVYLDHFASTRTNLIIAHFISNEVITNHIPQNLSPRFRKRIRFIAPMVGLHEGAQYMRYLRPNFNDQKLTAAHFSLSGKADKPRVAEKYVTIQPSTGNNKTPWKSWSLENWEQLVTELVSLFPKYHIVILGDDSESHLSSRFSQISNQVISLIGVTEMEELPALLEKSKLHIGGDSGLLHVAGCVGTRTVTIAGGSDPEIFGWHKIDPNIHLVVQHKLDCHPCYRWILPNQSRVNEAKLCPDFKCIRSISVIEMLDAIKKQLIR